jgi:hypothetical protein
MAAARAAKKAEPTTAVQTAEEVSDMSANRPTATLAETAARPAPVRKFAGREDVPAGVRPIQARTAVRREISAQEVGVEQAADTGYQSGGAALVVESGSVIGGGDATPRARVDSMGRRVAAPAGTSAAQVRGGVLFSDKAPDGGMTTLVKARQRAAGPAEPTGLPCTCVMPTQLRGQDPNITWCVTCGGERDGVARPENALRGKSIKDIRSALAGDTTAIDYNAVAQRTAELVLAQLDYDFIISSVIGVLDERAAQFAAGEHSEGPES